MQEDILQDDMPQDDVVVDEEVTQETDAPKDDMQLLKEECEKYKLGWQRANADYQNLVKQTEERRSELVRMSEWQIISEFIPVYSYFKKAVASAVDTSKVSDIEELKKQVNNWEQGISYILKQFTSVLESHGIHEIKTVGEQFDPNKHEVMKEEVSEQAEGTILAEVDPGYMMGDKIIQPAKVITATNES